LSVLSAYPTTLRGIAAALTIGKFGAARLGPQNPHDRNHRVPIPSRRWHAIQFVDLAEIADRFHVAAVHSEHKLPFARSHPHQPLSFGGKRDWERRPDTPGFRQDAHEPGNIRRWWLASKRVLLLQPHKVAAFTENNSRFKWQLAKQGSTELRSGSRFTNNEGPRSTHVHDIIAAQLSRKDAWAKRPVSANIDTPKEDNKGHSADYEENRQSAL